MFQFEHICRSNTDHRYKNVLKEWKDKPKYVNKWTEPLAYYRIQFTNAVAKLISFLLDSFGHLLHILCINIVETWMLQSK